MECSSRALQVTDASRRMGARAVLDGVSLSVKAGTIVGLLGPNGAGKTSLLRAAAGRLRLDRGHVLIDGVPTDEARRRARVGVVPQDVALYHHLTVRENLSVLGRLAGVPAADVRARVEEGVRWAGLADRTRALVSTLSGGMRRRVNLVAGTLHRPALLLLDEPTVGVDGEARTRLHDLLGALRARGMGLLMATHDVEEASQICDEVVVMAEGRVVAGGTVTGLVGDIFGDRREVSLVFAQTPTAEAIALLTMEQFRQVGGREWVSQTTGAVTGVEALGRRLQQAGAHLAEIRVAEPHLRGAVAIVLDRAARKSVA